MIPLFMIAHFGHHVLNALIAPLLPYIRTEFALSYAQAGFVSAAFAITYGIAQLPAGWLADRMGSPVVLLIGISGVAVGGALVGLSNGFPLVILTLLVMGLAGGCYHPSATSLISASVPAQRRGKALGLHIIGGSTSHFLAPLIAAGAVTLVGWRGTFIWLSIPVFVLGLVVLLVLRRTRPTVGNGLIAPGIGGAIGRERGVGVGGEGDETDGTESSAPVAQLVVFLVLSGITGAVLASVIPFVPLILVDRFATTPEAASAMLAIVFSAGFWAAPLGGHLSDRVGRVRVMLGVSVLLGPLIALMVVVPNRATMAAVLVAFGAVLFTKMPTAEAYVAQATSKRLRSTVLGIYFFSSAEGSALLTPGLGALIDARGFEEAFFWTAASMLAVVLVCGLLLYGIRRRGMSRPEAKPA